MFFRGNAISYTKLSGILYDILNVTSNKTSNLIKAPLRLSTDLILRFHQIYQTISYKFCNLVYLALYNNEFVKLLLNIEKH